MDTNNNLTNELDLSTERDSFVFYRSFKRAIDKLKSREQLIVYQAIANYALYRQEPELKNSADLAWVLIKPQLDANWRKYEKGCRGGAPKGNNNARKNNLKQPQNNLKQPNVNDNDNDNGNGNDNGWETTTTIPILSDIIDFVGEQRLDVDAHYFYDYYTSSGWMMGKKPMTDWRAALRNWSRISDKEDTPTNTQTHISNDL